MVEIDIGRVIGAHAIWKIRFEIAARNRTFETSASILSADDQCPFGKWLLGQSLSDDDKTTTDYNVVKDLHATFHQIAGKIVALIHEGHAAQADELLSGEFNITSGKLITALKVWDIKMLHEGHHPFNLDVAQACIPTRPEHRLRFAV